MSLPNRHAVLSAPAGADHTSAPLECAVLQEEPDAARRRSCPLCGADNGALGPLRHSRGGWRLKRCAACSMIYLENPPPVEKLAVDLAWEKTFAREAERRRREEPVVSLLSRIGERFKRHAASDKLKALVDTFFEPGPVLDVGCGYGAFAALGPDYTPYGIEVSEELAARADTQARARGGKVVRADAISGMRAFPERFFHGIIMHAYLEHEVEPVRALDEAARLLAPGGGAIIKVPNYRTFNRAVRGGAWCGFRFPDHVNYFTPRTLLGAVRAAGLEAVRFGFVDRLPTNDNMWMVCAPRSPGGAAGGSEGTAT